MEIEYKKTDEFEEFDKNPKEHPDSQIDKLVKSMEKFGFTNPVLYAGRPQAGNYEESFETNLLLILTFYSILMRMKV